jgi:Uma2 family endonuclease
MEPAQRAARPWTAEAFLGTDQRAFGALWRYELVRGRIVGHAAPTPEHGKITVALGSALLARLRGHPSGCHPEIGSGAAPARRQRDTARIPDVMIRCGEHPRVIFEVLSPSELRRWRERDEQREDLQAVEGVREIVEIYQGEPAIHVYRWAGEGSWRFASVRGLDAVLRLESVGIAVPLAEIYELIAFGEGPEAATLPGGPA